MPVSTSLGRLPGNRPLVRRLSSLALQADSRQRKVGSRRLEVGSRRLEAGSRRLGAGSPSLGAYHSPPVQQRRIGLGGLGEPCPGGSFGEHLQEHWKYSRCSEFFLDTAAAAAAAV